jgi:CheY-like chemotaxis protein
MLLTSTHDRIPTAARGSKNLLLVDSSPFFLKMAERIFTDLTKQTWKVFTVETYDAVLAAVLQERIDAVVLDIDMFGEYSMDFLSELHERFPAMPKVALTSSVVNTVRDRCMENGVRGCLQKPANVEDTQQLLSLLNELLESDEEVGFRGTVWVAGLTEILQLECLHRRSSILEVAAGVIRGRIFIEDGEIVHAEALGAEGMDALEVLLRLKRGDFHFRSFTAPSARTIVGRWELLLMEAAQKNDEGASFFMPSREEAVFAASSVS